MPIERLPESLQALYSELLDQSVQAEAERIARGLPPPGTFVAKRVKGRKYWYLQRMEAGRKRQYYLGPAGPALERWMERAEVGREEQRPDEGRRAELVAMLVSGGAARESVPTARVLRVLAEAGVFRLGGVLIGTQAFGCYGNLLGVRLSGRASRTQDIDLAPDPEIPVALDPQAVPADVERLLQQADPRFFAVPALDPDLPSTSFKVRGRDLRVDLLTPQRGAGSERPIRLPYLGAAAQPLPFLGYLIARPAQAVVLEGDGVLVNVPEPERFVFHKLWLSTERPAAQAAKAAKDRRQAAEVARVLLEDRPRALAKAAGELEKARRRAVRAAAAHLERDLAKRLAKLLA